MQNLSYGEIQSPSDQLGFWQDWWGTLWILWTSTGRGRHLHWQELNIILYVYYRPWRFKNGSIRKTLTLQVKHFKFKKHLFKCLKKGIGFLLFNISQKWAYYYLGKMKTEMSILGCRVSWQNFSLRFVMTCRDVLAQNFDF